jgi:hypothetical protein
MNAADRHGFGTSVIHRCETVPATGDRPVYHVVLPPRQPCETPITDLEDAGHEVLAYGVFPEEIPECPVADEYPGCEHLLLRRSE